MTGTTLVVVRAAEFSSRGQVTSSHLQNLRVRFRYCHHTVSSVSLKLHRPTDSLRAQRGPSFRSVRPTDGPDPYGDSMILAKCVFSQSATGEVSRAHIFASWPMARSRGGECKFSQTGAPNGDEARGAGGGGGRRGRGGEEPDYFDSSGDEISYVKRSRRR